MKTLRLWIFLLLIVSGAAGGRAYGTIVRNYGAAMSVDADLQADFYQRHPDLRDEPEMVAAAARTLAGEDVGTDDLAVAADLLAQRTHALLAQRTPEQWQGKAVSLFPELGVAGSEFNTLFLRHYNELKRTSPQFTKEPSWPVLLARRCADELQSPAHSVPSAAPLKETPVRPAPTPPVKSWVQWAMWLEFVVLLAIIVQPARWLFRCRRAFAGGGAPLTVWQSALGVGAWTYLLVALIGLGRTFAVNADQPFMDRFGISLLVSLLAGIAFALPMYALTLGIIWWWRQRTRPDPADALTPGDRKSRSE